MAERRIEMMPVAEIKLDPANPKDHDIGQLISSMRRFGYGEAVLLDERTGTLVAGHGRIEALRAMMEKGEDAPAGVVADVGGWSAPVQRGWASKNEREAHAYLLAANRLTEIGGWNEGSLERMLAELGGSFEGTGYSADDYQDLLERLGKVGNKGQVDPDDAPEPKSDPWVKTGDIITMGPHVIACGDCTDAALIDKLMGGIAADICWTDPPWNVAYGENLNPAGWSGKHRPIANDNLGSKFPAFCADFTKSIRSALKPGAPLYLAMSAQEWPVIHAALAVAFHWSSTIIWAKDSLVLSRKDYHTQYEPIWYGWLDGSARIHPVVDRKQSDLWSIPRPKRSAEHPTMKPVELVARSISNSSRPGDVVFDPFSGSGTTVIAAEQTGRCARVVELEPAYVQVAVERWEAFTGNRAVRP